MQYRSGLVKHESKCRYWFTFSIRVVCVFKNFFFKFQCLCLSEFYNSMYAFKMAQVSLQGSDLGVVLVDTKVAKLSTWVTKHLDKEDTTAACEEKLLHLDSVSSKVLDKVFLWCKLFLDSQTKTPNGENWEEAFFVANDVFMIDIAVAAEYLGIPQLHENAIERIAGMITGRSLSAIRQSFGIESDMSAEEEQLVRTENSWCKKMKD